MESSAFVYTENESGLGVMPVNDSLTAHMGRYNNDMPKRISSTGKKTRKPRVLKPAPNRPGPVLTTQPVQQSVARTHPYKKTVKTGGKKKPLRKSDREILTHILDTVESGGQKQAKESPAGKHQESQDSFSVKGFYEENKTKVLIGGGIAGTLLLIKFLR